MRTTRTGRAVIAAAGALAALAVVGPATAGANYTPQFSVDTLRLVGDDSSDALLVTTDASNNVVYAVNNGPAQPTNVPVANVARFVIDANGGDDQTIFLGNLPGADVNGGPGNDTLGGTPKPDRVDGGEGNDDLRPLRDNDTAIGGPGDDTVSWNPGDGTDTIDGGDGDDQLLFNGSNIGEVMTLSAVTGTPDIRLTRDVAAVTQTFRNTERLRVTMLGGIDRFTSADDLGPSGLKTLDVDLGPGVPGGAPQVFDGSDVRDIGTGAPGTDQFTGGPGDDTWNWKPGDGDDVVTGGEGTDNAFVTGSDQADIFRAESPQPGAVQVSSDSPADHFTGQLDRVTIDLLGGNDRFIPIGDVTSTVDLRGGAGADVLEGTPGADALHGGEGDDALFGRGGDDQLFGDAGTDELSGGPGSDSFACGGQGDSFDAVAGETVDPDCLPPAEPTGDGGGPTGPTGPGPNDHSDDPPPGFLGFGTPAVRATATGLSVTVKNTSAKPIRLSFAALERIGRGKLTRYRVVTRTIAPGAKAIVALKAPAALRKQIGRGLQRTGRLGRRPSVGVTNVDTDGKRTLKPRVVLVQH
jgi:Ca2+-binding RTX toxin-like protein